MDLSSYEENLALKLKAVPKEKYFYIYSIAGRELTDFKLYLLAQKYFYLALQEETKEDKTQIYLKLLQLNYHRRAIKEAKENYKNLNSYWHNNQEFQKRGRIIYAETLTFLESWIFADDPQSVANGRTTPFIQGSGSDLTFKNTSYRKTYKDGDYEKALELLDKEKIINSNSVDLQAEYDLLIALTQKGDLTGHQLICTKLWKKYQKSYSYGILICDILHGYQHNKKIDSKKEQELSDYFDNFDDDMSFLLKALTNLK